MASPFPSSDSVPAPWDSVCGQGSQCLGQKCPISPTDALAVPCQAASPHTATAGAALWALSAPQTTQPNCLHGLDLPPSLPFPKTRAGRGDTVGNPLSLVLSSAIFNDLIPRRDNFYKFILFIYFWLCWVFVSVRGLSLVTVSGGHSSSQCAGLSLSRPLLLRSTGSGRAGSVVVAHGTSCSLACGILPDQGSNPCPLHWQADSQPLRHQGSPGIIFKHTSI